MHACGRASLLSNAERRDAARILDILNESSLFRQASPL
jgi:hypothetical protein